MIERVQKQSDTETEAATVGTVPKHLEAQLRQGQKMQALGSLSAGIAHDFNNILASISGYTQLANLLVVGNSKVTAHLDAVLKATRRATDLVAQILTFSRESEVQRKVLQLHPIVVESLDLLRATIPSCVEFKLTLASDAPLVLADATQIHQILMNLGANACHAMQGGNGQLAVSLGKVVVDPQEISVASRPRAGSYARISVTDTGKGMDEATMGRIFEPFFTTKSTGEGTGLGLTVVNTIVKAYHGHITVESEAGEGTTFHIYLPEAAGISASSPVEMSEIPRGNKEWILYVDDEEALVTLGKETLEHLNYEVEGTTDPEVALALVRADPTRYSLVITDQTMPCMSGLSLARALLAIRPSIPIILLTGSNLAMTQERAEAAGVYQLLQKPTSLRALAAAIHAGLR